MGLPGPLVPGKYNLLERLHRDDRTICIPNVPYIQYESRKAMPFSLPFAHSAVFMCGQLRQMNKLFFSFVCVCVDVRV